MTGDQRFAVDVPAPDANWGEIAAFAYALGVRRGFEDLGEDLRSYAAQCLLRFIENGAVPVSRGDAERFLFGFQRIHHWSDSPPVAVSMTLVRALISQLHSATNGDLEQSRAGSAALPELLDAASRYRVARLAFLAALGVPAMRASNRDPLAEFSEVLSAVLHAGTLANSRTQRGYDVISASGERVQVKYLANPHGIWINGHVVQVIPDVERYDLVVFEDLFPVALLSFPLSNLAAVASVLRKRHPGTDKLLQLTQANVRRLIDRSDEFESLGVRVAAFPPFPSG